MRAALFLTPLPVLWLERSPDMCRGMADVRAVEKKSAIWPRPDPGLARQEPGDTARERP